MTKQEVIIACMLATKRDAMRDDAEAFAASIWNDHFSHVDFMTWNGEVPQSEADRLIAISRSRESIDIKELIEHLM